MIQEIDNSTYSSQLVSLTNTSVATTNGITTSNGLVRIAVTNACYMKIAGTPTATTADTLLPAGSVSFFKIASGDKVALLGLAVTTGTATVTAMESVTI
jgi:hypothetical protein